MEPSAFAQQSAASQGMMAGFLIFFGIAGLFAIIIQWKINVKAGQPGWACLIPIYNIIIYLRIIGRPVSWLFVYLGCLILYGIGIYTMFLNPASPSAVSGILTFASILTLVIVSIIDTNRLSKSFGRGVGFTVGLVLLSLIFMAILAFGNDAYIGPNGIGGSDNNDPDILHN